MKTTRILIFFFLLGICHGLSAQNTGLTIGTPEGSFSVSPLGGAAYTIPIDMPAGICDMTPQVSITYNSQNGNGLCGWGCNIGGISAITRGAKDIYHDGAASGISHGFDDAFYLDGQRLVMTQAPAGSDSAVYCLETNPYTRIVLHGLNEDYQFSMYFTVDSPDGMRYEYGKIGTCQYYYADGAKVNAWYLGSAKSLTGNEISYTYVFDNYYAYPIEIRYGNGINRIKFEYEERPDTVRFSLEGVKGCMGRRLKSVKTKSLVNGNEKLYRNYILNYAQPDNSTIGYSRLTSVTLSNDSAQAMNPIVFSWDGLQAFCCSKNTPSFSSSIYTDGAVYDEISFYAADLNGDGMTDLVEKGRTHTPANPYNFLRIYNSCTNSSGCVYFNLSDNIQIEEDLYTDSWSYISTGPVAADTDGDGINELVLPRLLNFYEVSSLRLETYKAGNYAGGVEYSDLHVTNLNNVLWSAADFDNNGKCDFVVLEKAKEGSSSNYYGCIMGSYNPAAFCQHFLFSLPKEPRHVLTADMDCDGLSDVIVFYENGYSVFYNDGTWLDNITPNHLLEETPIQPVAHTYSINYDPAHVWPGDFNGDGITDFLLSIYNSGNLYFELGNGNGVFEEKLAASTEIYDQWGTSKDDGQMNCQVIDMDGDGLSDVVITKAMYKKHNPIIGSSYYRFDKTYTYWMRSNGKELITQSTATSLKDSDAAGQYYVSGDFNGDGLYEMASLSYDCYSGNNANEDAVFRIYQNGNHQIADGKINTITDGLGRQTHIVYKPLTDSSVYTKGSSNLSFPVITITPSLTVVATVQDDEMTGETSYSYEGLQTHVQGRGLLGMSVTTANHITLGQTEQKRVDCWDNSSFLPAQVTEKLTAGSDSMKTVTTNTYSNHNTPLTYVPTQQISRTTDFDGNITIERTNYSRFMNGSITSATHIFNDDIADETCYSYGCFGGRYLPVRSERLDWQGGLPADTCINTYSYNDKGLMTSKVENVSTDFALTTDYTYDYRGNPTSATTTGSDVETVTKTWQYDYTMRFITRCVERGYIRTDYTHDCWGNVLAETDNTRYSYPRTTTYTYDGWGRMTSSTSPEGAVTTYSYGWGPSTNRRYYTYQASNCAPWVKTWYDNTGRETCIESIGPNNMTVETQTTYNSKGQVTARQVAEGQRSQTENFTYDNRGRLLTHTATPGTQTIYSYGNRSVTATTNGRSHTQQYNSQGNIVYTSDPIASVAYQYAPCGKPHTVSSSGSTVTMTYDKCGNQTSLSDPDAGQQEYTYDALHRVISQTDGNGIQTTNTYNTCGQLTATTTGNATTTYSYGTYGISYGLPISMTRGQFSTAYQYDNIGRVIAETRSYPGGTTLSFGYTYNDLGQLTQADYPGDVIVGYGYDSHGFLNSMMVNGQQVYNHTYSNGVRDSMLLLNTYAYTADYDSYGYLTEQKWDRNGIYRNKIYEFDKVTGNLKKQSARYFNLVPIGPKSGNLDPKGSTPGTPIPYGQQFEDHYSYDALDRLVSVRDYLNQLQDTIVYAANGNILSRTAIGAYTYDASGKPHAVLSVTNPQGLVSQETLETTFGDLGKIEQLEQGDYETTIDYGPDGERWRSVLQDDGSVTRTVLYAGDYEMVTTGSVTRHFYYLGNGIIVMKEGSTVTPLVAVADHLGSITHLMKGDGTTMFAASYDAWGRQTVTTNTIGFHRGYCGHEMLPEYGLINMNGRLYDPLLGRFLSPDNYVQQPDNSQNFNRYTYCLNNPLKYNDPSGEFLHIIFGAVVGGFVNLAANWDNIDGFWQGFTAFTVGAGSGAAVAATGGAVGAGFWSVMGVSAASGAVTSATNNIIAQTGRNFSGFGNVNWTDVGKSSIVGAASCAASGAAGYYVQKLSVSFQGFQIKSPVLKSAIVSPLAAGAGHIAGGTIYGLAEGLDLKDAFSSSLDGIWNSMAIGGAIGVASTMGTCYANKINPWTGNSLKTDIVPYYPPNDGALDKWTEALLKEGVMIDRYGSETGRFASPAGVPYEQRALPPGNTGEYHLYKIQVPFGVQKSTVMPWFYQIGYGTQYKLPMNVRLLIENGYIIRIK